MKQYILTIISSRGELRQSHLPAGFASPKKMHILNDKEKTKSDLNSTQMGGFDCNEKIRIEFNVDERFGKEMIGKFGHKSGRSVDDLAKYKTIMKRKRSIDVKASR